MIAESGEPRLGLQLDEDYENETFDTSLDISSVGDNTELWILQVPPHFPDKKTSWKVLKTQDATGIIATCSIGGNEYFMSEDSNPEKIFIVNGSDKRRKNQAPLRVDRRLNIFRSTRAPEICFGMNSKELTAIDDLGSPAPRLREAVGGGEKQDDKQTKKKKRKEAGDEEGGKTKKKKKKGKE